MNPITHALMGFAASTVSDLKLFSKQSEQPTLEADAKMQSVLSLRERGLVVLASIIPDFDGLGVVVDFFTRNSSSPTELWGRYHHILGHNLLTALVMCGVAFALSKRKLLTTLLVFVSFHLHILGDIIGGKGPTGNQWPIPYFYPLNSDFTLTWQHQWALNAWPNFVITAFLLIYMFRVAYKYGSSPLEFVSTKWNAAFVKTLRDRFGRGAPD